MKFFRVLIALLAIAAVAGSFALFFETEQKNKKLNEIKPQAEAMYAEWSAQNNCAEEQSQPCKTYSQQFKEWVSKFGEYKEHKEQSPQFKGYFFLKDKDKEYAGEYNYGGLASLAAGSLAFLIISFLFVAILGKLGKKPEYSYKSKSTRRNETEYRQSLRSEPRLEPMPSQPPSPTAKLESIPSKPEPAKPGTKPDHELIQKATECAESSPMQAISYLEQALEKTSDDLRNPALLLCGSLRIKHKIGEDQGKAQLQKIIGSSPQSLEAQEAKIILNAFK